MSADAAASGATMVDAQFGVIRVLKPFPGFEAVYQGQSSALPIAFPGVRDPRAAQRKPGFDPDLMAGVSVPLGARMKLSFPMTPDAEGDFTGYEYQIVWRPNNLNDYRDPPVQGARPPYHFPRQSPGAPDSTLTPPAPRTVRPAIWQTHAYIQTEAGGSDAPINLRPLVIRVPAVSVLDLTRPLLPDGRSGVLQQGILDPDTNPVAAPIPLFLHHEIEKAESDEFIVLARRTNQGASANWDFAGVDAPFSNIYGTGGGTHPNHREVGISFTTGTAP